MEITQEVRDEGLEPGVAGTASPKAHIIINTLIFPSKLFYMILRMAGVDACIRGVDISSSSLCEFIMSQASRYTYLEAHAPDPK